MLTSPNRSTFPSELETSKPSCSSCSPSPSSSPCPSSFYSSSKSSSSKTNLSSTISIPNSFNSLPKSVPVPPYGTSCSTHSSSITYPVSSSLPASHTNSPLQDISLSPVSEVLIPHLKRLNSVLFPVVYNDRFYKDVLYTHPQGLSAIGNSIIPLRITYIYVSI